MSSNESPITPGDVLAVFDRQPQPGAPLSAPEVADEVGCVRRTAYNKLAALAEEDALNTKKVGARARVWWRPPADEDDVDVDERTHDGHGERRVERLRELHRASRRLMQAETQQTVCTIAVEAAQRILGLSLNGVWWYDADREVLEPVAWTDPGVEAYGEPPAFPIEGTLVGRAFREGTFRAYDDITAEGELYDPDTDVRSELVLPLGDYGVLNASSPTVGAFDAVDVSLARILAANIETALDQTRQLERRRARRRELEHQRDELETLNGINARIEDAIGALVGAATRNGIERTVCERLAASERYADAWIVERDRSADAIVRRTSGLDDEAGEPLARWAEGATDGNPVARALTERSVQTVSGVAEAPDVPARFRAVAEATGARACLVIPLTYADTVFGALVVCAPEPDAFSTRETAAFETLGRVVGFAINATNNRRLLLGNTAVELEVGLRGTDAWFLSASTRLEGSVTVEGLVPTGDGSVIEYGTFEGDDVETVRAVLDELPAVEETRPIAADDGRCFVECVVRAADAGLGAITEYGASICTARAANGDGTVVARFPTAASTREAMAVVREPYPEATFTAKRVVDVSDRSVTTVRQELADQLTEKQVAALRAAFLAGYYETPRETTAQELAASLTIAPSTLYQHLQAAHRKLLAMAFDDLSDPN